MRIACLINRYPAASHSFIRREIRALEGNGINVTRISIRANSDDVTDPEDKKEAERTRVILGMGAIGLVLGILRTALTRPGRLVRAIGVAIKIGWRSDRGLLRHLVYVAEACVLARWLRQSGVQHLHAHFATNSTAVAMFCRILGGPPYSFTSHGIEMSDCPETLGLREKIRRAAFAVAVSEFGRSQLYRWCRHEDWPKIHVIRCGVDHQFLSAPHEPPPTTPRLVSVGRLSEEKGQRLLVEAVGRLVAEGLAVELVLVGDGPLRGCIESLIEERGLRSCIRITGWASGDEVRGHILASRAMVLPSFAEGLPVVIMEALALGRPVISTYVAGIPELVEHGVCGWLVPAGSVDALAAAMREAVEAVPEQLEAMGRRGAERVADMHDARKEARKLIALFENGLGKTGKEEAVAPGG